MNIEQLFKKVSPEEITDNVFKLTGKDFFLITAGKEDHYNSMVGSGGGLGMLFRRPVTWCLLRTDRYTLELIEKELTYTLSYFPEEHKGKMLFLGKKSGRDSGKMSEVELSSIRTPSGNMSFMEANLIIECKLLQITIPSPDDFYLQEARDYLFEAYKDENEYRKYVFGEITHVWVKKIKEDLKDAISPIELGRQLKKPTGELGLVVAESMNVANEQIYDFVISHLIIRDHAKILEIGCGNGKFISKFFDANPEIHVTALDYADVMCSEATALNKGFINDNKLIVKCEDAIDMSFPDESFDIVVTINTVYFWEQVERQLDEIKRVLKQGGLFVIGYRPKSVMKDFPSTQEVFHLYEPDDMRFLVSQNGFEIIREEKQATHRKAVDGSWIQSVDICLMVK